MKYSFLVLLFIFSLSSLPISTFAVEKKKDVLKVGVYTIEPFFIFSDSKITGGVTYKLLEMIKNESNLNFTYEAYPYPIVLARLESGDIDLAIFYPSNILKENIQALSKTLGNDNIIYSNNKLKAKSIKDLEGHAVAVINGASYSKEFDNNPKITKKAYTTYKQSISVYSHGRVDAIVLPKVASNYYLNIMKLDKSLFKNSFILNHKNNWIHVRDGLDAKLVEKIKTANDFILKKKELKSLYDLYD